MENVVIENDYGRAVVSPGAGAALRSLRVKAGRAAQELLHGGDAELDPAKLPQGTGSFIMAPWPNRIRDGRLIAPDGEHVLPVNSGVHAIHGLLREREWQVVEKSSTAVMLRAELQPPWPYRGAVISRTALNGPALEQTLVVEAAPGEKPFPAGFGWHPWFRRSLGPAPSASSGPGPSTHSASSGQASSVPPAAEDKQASLRALAEAMWVLDPTVTPTGETVRPPIISQLEKGARLAAGSIDGCFRLAPGHRATLSWPEIKLNIVSSDTVSHLMVYTPKDGTALCVEPQTCCVNATQLAARGVAGTGAAVAAPGAPLTGWTRWSWG